ncbi:MAG: PEP-CTERM sorting domain-containing protein [Pirellulales bacterium]|nr:PEP-CTERM sorting domain-containing protein [Pirellulales bacterium]
MKYLMMLLAVTLCIASTQTASAHGLRRFEVLVIDDQLFAQGYLTDPSQDDTDGAGRPYYNALHDHFENQGTGALARLPGFDVLTPGALLGHSLTAELTGAKIWRTPHATNTPVLESLAPGDGTLSVDFSKDADPGPIANISSTVSDLETFTLRSSIDGSAADLDLDFEFVITPNEPAGVIYVLEWTLGTSAPGIADSDTVYTILSPDGANPMERLHHASLNLERFLGTPHATAAPEPTSLALAALGLVSIALRRRRTTRK